MKRRIAADLLLLACAASTGLSALEVDSRLPHYLPTAVEIQPSASYLTTDGHVAVVGYNDMQEMLEALDGLFERTHPGIRFALTLKGTRTAPPALAAGTSAFAPMGAEFSATELSAYRQAVASDPIAFRVAHDSVDPQALSAPLAVFVPAANPLSMLTIEQVARIFTTQATGAGTQKWSELGLSGEWTGRSIHLYGLGPTTALGAFMQRQALHGRPYDNSFIGLPQSAEVVRRVSEDPLAIGFAAMNRATPAVKVVPLALDGSEPSRGTTEDLVAGRYPLDRYLLIYVRLPPGRALDRMVREYLRLVLSLEGQQTIAAGRLGYLPLNAQETAAERIRLEALP